MPAIEAWNGMGIAARVILVVLVALLLLLFIGRAFASYRRAERPQARRRSAASCGRYTPSRPSRSRPRCWPAGTLSGHQRLRGMAMVMFDLRAVELASEALLMTVLGLVIGLPAWWAHAALAWAGESCPSAGVRPARAPAFVRARADGGPQPPR
jgi:heme A synthase